MPVLKESSTTDTTDDNNSECMPRDDILAAEDVQLLPQPFFKRSCVLVVDDSIMVQKLLCRSLARLKFDTDTACNGRDALAKMKSIRYRAVLMNFVMPVMDGIAATAAFRAWERESRTDDTTLDQAYQSTSESARGNCCRQLVIGISANVSDIELESAWEAGIDHLSVKPIKVCR